MAASLRQSVLHNCGRRGRERESPSSVRIQLNIPVQSIPTGSPLVRLSSAVPPPMSHLIPAEVHLLTKSTSPPFNPVLYSKSEPPAASDCCQSFIHSDLFCASNKYCDRARHSSAHPQSTRPPQLTCPCYKLACRVRQRSGRPRATLNAHNVTSKHCSSW